MIDMVDNNNYALNSTIIKVSRVPNFTIEELYERMGRDLGKGAFGTVYSVEGFPNLAIKEVRTDNICEKVLRSINFELAIFPKLSHPGILKYHQTIEDGDFIYIVMDRYDGNLEELLIKHMRTHKPIPDELFFSILKQIATALAYLHKPDKVDTNGESLPCIIHRDLKPANILMTIDGKRAVLADFGLCKDALRNSSTTKAGTPAYMAPETLLHKTTSSFADIWAFGVIVYELTVLSRPNFLNKQEPQDAFVNGWKPNLSAVKDESIRSILEKIFVLDPEERPTAKELAELFQASSALLNKSEHERNTLLDRSMYLEGVSSGVNSQTIICEETTGIRSVNTSILKDIDPQCAIAGRTPTLDSSIFIQDSSWTPLMRATISGDVETARKYLASKNKKSNRGETAYTLAIKASQGAMLELLDPTDRSGVTALMRAADKGDIEAVRLLIPLQRRRQAAGEVQMSGLCVPNRTALMGAAIHGHTNVVRLLIEHETGMLDNTGSTALILAAFHNRPECAALLLEKEAYMQKSDGLIALMIAAWNGYLRCVELLVEKEAGLQDKYGRTALIWAIVDNHPDCAQLLVEKESELKTKYEWNRFPSGLTAFDIAKIRGYTEILSILSPELSQ